MTHPLVHALVELGSDAPEQQEPEARTTKGVVASMLTENTGRHMLDSGGAYGRGWERNQGRDFDAEPVATVSWKWGYFDITINLYHFLTEALEYEEELDRAFEAWCLEDHHEKENWFTCIEDFVDAIEQGDEHPTVERFREDAELYGGNPWTGEQGRWTVNTYNGEDLLSQVIQYTMIGDLVFLQVHGGCDVRGGYTQPRVFRVNEWPALIDNAKANLCCSDHECGARWYTDDAGYHWYDDVRNGEMPDTDAWVDITEPEGRAKLIVEQAERYLEENHPALFETHRAQRTSEHLFYDSDEDYALCPVCLEARLEASY